MPFYSHSIIIFVQVFFNRVQMNPQNNMYNHKEKEDILLNIEKKIFGTCLHFEKNWVCLAGFVHNPHQTWLIVIFLDCCQDKKYIHPWAEHAITRDILLLWKIPLTLNREFTKLFHPMHWSGQRGSEGIILDCLLANTSRPSHGYALLGSVYLRQFSLKKILDEPRIKEIFSPSGCICCNFFSPGRHW